jgi:hypothetical protein
MIKMELSDYFKKMSSDLEVLSSDIPRLINCIGKKEENQGKGLNGNALNVGESKKFQGLPPRSLEPITTLRKNKEEVIEASQNKEEFFLKDKINEILSK